MGGRPTCRYLRECLIEEEVLTMRSFERYQPPQGLTRTNMVGAPPPPPPSCAGPSSQGAPSPVPRLQVLDGVCLQNLEVLRNASGGTQGTLLATMDGCCTPFGGWLPVHAGEGVRVPEQLWSACEKVGHYLFN